MKHGKHDDKGKLPPTGDGRGTNHPPEKTPLASVDVQARTDVPGGESKSGAGIEIQGPNKA